MTDPAELRRQAAALTAEADQLDLTQLSSIDGMSPEAITEAREAGRLQVLMGADPAEVALSQRAAHGRINTDDVKALFAAGHHDLITAARADDRIDLPATNQGETA